MQTWIAPTGWLFGLLAVTALAGERPTLPGAAIDAKLLQGKTPQEFFTNRVRKCTGLGELRSHYLQEKKRFKTLLTQQASSQRLEKQQERVAEAQQKWFARVQECGPCHLRPVERVKVTNAGSTENWFVSDGSCFIPGLTQDQAKRAFETRAKSLETVADYKAATGGFQQVVEFLPIHPTTGRPTGVAQIPTPYEGFIAVRGPKLFGVRTAAGYYFQGSYKGWTDGSGTHYLSQFSAKRPPRGFREPRIKETDFDGDTHRVRLISLSNSQGQWYLTEDGYLRYTTAADFGLSLKFLSDMAESILLETLLDLSERGLPE